MSSNPPSLLVFTLAALLLAGEGAAAQDRLMTEPYPSDLPWKFVMDEMSPQGIRVREQIPSHQNIDAYRDILVEQSMPVEAAITPGQFLSFSASLTGQSCDGVRMNGPIEKTEAGVKVAYIHIYCGRQKAKAFGVYMHMKALRGRDHIYLVNREFRVPPSEVGGVSVFPKEQAKEAEAFMTAQTLANIYLTKSVYLCGGPSTDPRCAAKK